MAKTNYAAHTFTFTEVQQILKAATTASLMKDLNYDQSEKSIAQDIYDAIESDFYNYVDDREFDKLGVQTASPLTSTSSRGVVTSSPREAE